jgi:hypothetical protein
MSGSHFDRGVWDTQDCGWQIGCKSGDPSMHVGNGTTVIILNFNLFSYCFYSLPTVKYVCCFQEFECCVFNPFSPFEHFSCCPSETVHVIPAETICCCCPTRATDCTNYCGLCGIQTGEPTILRPFLSCLQVGTSQQFVHNMNNARSIWKQNMQKK